MIHLHKLIPKHLRDNIDLLKKTILTEHIVKLDITENDNKILLSKIVVPEKDRNKGTGTKIMLELIKYADSKNEIITLTPNGNISKLKRYFKRFGFVENNGKNKDYTITEAMYRLPK